MTWPTQATARLKELAANGLSSAQIAAEFGCSRLAVKGKASRCNISLNYGKLGRRHGHAVTPETRAKQSVGMKAHWQSHPLSPEVREKISAAMKARWQARRDMRP